MRTLNGVVVTCVLFALVGGSTGSANRPHARPEAALRVVSVEHHRVRQCLGTQVRGGWVLTARHCVQSRGAYRSVLAHSQWSVSSRKWRANVVYGVGLSPRYTHLGELQGSDLALLKLDGAGPRPPPVAPPAIARPVPGQRAWLLSLREGALEAVRTRIVRVSAKSIVTERVTMVTDSGGPLVSSDGALLAVASWRTRAESRAGRAASFFTRVDAHANWLTGTMERGVDAGNAR